MTLFDPSDIRDPVALLQKISTAKKRPVSVSVPVSDPYFIFSAPRALDKITGQYRWISDVWYKGLFTLSSVF